MPTGKGLSPRPRGGKVERHDGGSFFDPWAEVGLADSVLGKFGYLGIVLLLILGGLGVPVPEEAPIIGAAILSRHNQMFWPIALAACFLGVLVGDFIVYAMGYFYGEKVMSFPLTRKFLSPQREAQIKGYFHRHGIRILITGRFVPGFRTAAYLTAGILRLPPLKLFLADLCAATMSTLLMFALGYYFAHWVETQWKKTQGYVVIVLGVAIVAVLLYRHYKARKRGGAVVGPPVPVTDTVPVPVDDLHSGLLKLPKKPQATVPEAPSGELPAIATEARAEVVTPPLDPPTVADTSFGENLVDCPTAKEQPEPQPRA